MDAFLLDAVRTPFGRYRGGLSHIRTDDLAALPLAELIRRNPDLDPADIEDVVLGDTNGAGEDNRNVARMAALLAGLPTSVPGVTVNRLCASGGEAIVQAARQLAAGDARYVVAGGVESMSRAPYVLPRPDETLPRDMQLVPTVVGWRMVNSRFSPEWTAPLGLCAQQVADRYGIGREELDAWAERSHRRANEAWDKALHDDYVLEIEGPDGVLIRDESIRPETSVTGLRKLRSAFSPDGTGTAGNSSPINDGAIAVLMGTALSAEALSLEPIARVVAATTTARVPNEFTIAPVDAIRKLLARTGHTFDDIAVWELNEAFSAMVLSCLHDMPELASRVDTDVNPNGGAIAIGHPLGASVPRVIVDCARELARRGGGLGIAAACIGVGQGTAVLLEV